MRSLLTRNGRIVFAIAGFCIVLIAFIWIRLTRQLQADRQETIQTAVQRNSNLAVALEQYAIRTIENGDAVLQLVKREYERDGRKINISDILENHTVENEFLVGVAIADENGDVVVSDFKLQNGMVINIKDRDHFQHHVKNPYGGLFIGKPLRSRTVNKAGNPFDPQDQ